MSKIDSEEVKNHDVASDKSRSPRRCRIPQAQTVPRLRHPTVQQSPTKQNNPSSRPRSGARSDTTSRVEKPPPPARKMQTYKRPTFSSKLSSLQAQNAPKLPKAHQLGPGKLPDQETIKKREQMELNGGYNDTEDSTDTISVQNSWQKKINQFDNMKRDLEIQQKNIMELYASLRNCHNTMKLLGQTVNMPSAEDLRIMNVAKLTPDQLLQLCAGSRLPDEPSTMQASPATIDMNKLYDMPTKLVATCEQTLLKRQEVIDWFQALKEEEKGISMSKLTKKINEFNAENEMLHSSLQTCKSDFLKELNEIVDYLRKCVNEMIAFQLRTEELMYEVSELHAQNADLRKQLQSTEHLRSMHNKHRVEELEKELKEEKGKKIALKDRLTRAEGQVKIGNERATQLEAALELARTQNWTLERTVQQLNEQNQNLQSDFDKELSKLTESIQNNTTNLEDIAEAREKLQAEKEQLQRTLQALTDSSKESIENLNKELNKSIRTLQETEAKLELEKQERIKLESKLESLCAQLLESELRYKDTLKKMLEQKEELNKAVVMSCELEATRQSLEATNKELEEYKIRLMAQGETINEIERNFKDTVVLEKTLRTDLRAKEKYIAELEKKQSLLEQEIHEREHKMESYENQLSALKNQIEQIQNQFGEFENFDQLHEMINQQRDKLLETTRQNGDLANAIQQKDAELENNLEHVTELEQLLEQRDGVIKMLTDKEEEQANIIKLLRNNLEMRTQADSNLTQELAEKNAEIDSLVSSIDNRKQQVSQLEKIILTLEEQLRKVHLQRKRDNDKMAMLEKAITDYEPFPVNKQSVESPVDNLDNLIKILEDELGTSFDQNQDKSTKKVQSERKKVEKVEHFAEGKHEGFNYPEEHNYKPPPGNEKQPMSDQERHKILINLERERLDRKKAITKIETQKWRPTQEPINVYTSCMEKNTIQPFRGMVPVVQIITGTRDNKNGKMFKFAGHKL